MKNKLLFILGVVVIFGGVFFWNSHTNTPNDNRPSVIATFYPIAFLAEQIGGDFVTVKTIVPPGIEPHDFDPSLRDISGMYESDLVLMGGMGMDAWAEKLKDELLEKGVNVAVLSSFIRMTEGEQTSKVDPHFWLDPILYMESAKLVFLALVKIDPEHESEYLVNLSRLEIHLRAIDTHFQTLSSPDCRLDTVIVSHDAFSYLSKRYGFKVQSLSGINPEQEVSAGTLTDVIRIMQEKNIHFVLTEPLGNRDAVATIQKELSAEILTLNPIEAVLRSEVSVGENYYTVMNSNWITLRKALECE